MKATELLEKLQNVFLSSQEETTEVELTEEVVEEVAVEAAPEATEEVELTEEVSEEVKEELSEVTEEVIEATEEVELSEEVTEEASEEVELAEEVSEEEPKVDVEAAPAYVTSEELSLLKNEMMSMIESLLKEKQESYKEIPAQLSEQVELSEEVEEISHSPEQEVEAKSNNLYAQSRVATTKDRVFAKLFK